MKRRTWILAVAAVALIAVSLVMLLRGAEKPTFGFVEEIYTAASSRIELEIFEEHPALAEILHDGAIGRLELEVVEGDAEYFESISLVSGVGGVSLEVVAKEDAPPITVGTYIWENNHRDTWLTPGGSEQGCVDRVTGDDGLERIGELYGGGGTYLQALDDPNYPFVEEYTLNNPYNPELTAAYLGCRAAFDADGGEYLITVYYRMCTIEPLPERDPNDWRTPPKGKAIYTTSEELYSVVCRLVIPERSGAKYDLLFPVVDTYSVGWGDDAALRREFYFCLRGDNLPYLDLDTVKFERDGEEVEFVNEYRHDGGEARYIRGDEYYHKYPAVDSMDGIAHYYPFVCPDEDEGFDSNDVYGVTLEFVENEDGTGERYTLTLRLKFSEED